MNTEDLIHKLVLDLKPVKRVSSIEARFLFWLCAAVLSLVVAIFVVGLRPDLLSEITSVKFGFQMGAIAGLAIFSALTAILISVPGSEASRMPFILTVASFLGWFVYLIGTVMTSPAEALHAGEGICCSRTALLFALPVVGVLAVMAYRAAPIRPRLVGLFLAFAGAGVGALAALISCANDNSMHLIVWHFLPLLLIGSAGVFLGYFFNWQRRAVSRF